MTPKQAVLMALGLFLIPILLGVLAILAVKFLKKSNPEEEHGPH